MYMYTGSPELYLLSTLYITRVINSLFQAFSHFTVLQGQVARSWPVGPRNNAKLIRVFLKVYLSIYLSVYMYISTYPQSQVQSSIHIDRNIDNPVMTQAW